MLKRSSIYTMIICLSFSFLIVTYSKLSAEEAVSAKEAVKYLDKSKYTSAEIKKYYRALKKKKVKGIGRVVEVRKGRKAFSVAVLVDGTKPISKRKEYNLVVITTQDAGTELKKNDRVSFEGIFIRYAMFTVDNIDLKGTYKKIK